MYAEVAASIQVQLQNPTWDLEYIKSVLMLNIVINPNTSLVIFTGTHIFSSCLFVWGLYRLT